jgi:hypothetical protein
MRFGLDEYISDRRPKRARKHRDYIAAARKGQLTKAARRLRAAKAAKA